jgi:hypothetical protein
VPTGFLMSSAFDILRGPYGVKLVHIQGVSPKTFETLKVICQRVLMKFKMQIFYMVKSKLPLCM